MGQIPAKYFPPPAPYGSSPNIGAIGAPTEIDTSSNPQPPGSGFGPPPPGGGGQYVGGPMVPPVQQTIDMINKKTGGAGTS